MVNRLAIVQLHKKTIAQNEINFDLIYILFYIFFWDFFAASFLAVSCVPVMSICFCVCINFITHCVL